MTSSNEQKKSPQYIAALIACGGAFAIGTTLGWSAPAFAHLVYENNTCDGMKPIGGIILKKRTISDYPFVVTESEYSWIVSLMSLGAAVLCIPAGFIVKKIGRKPTMLLLLAPLLLGWILIIWAENKEMVMAGRFFTGVATGAYCVVIPIYNGEIADNERRGQIGSFFQLMINVGILFVYSVGVAVNIPTFSLICAVMPVLFYIFLLYIPESPTYLIGKGHLSHAKRSLEWLRGEDYDSKKELDGIQSQFDELKANIVTTRSSFMKPATIRAMIIAYGTMFFFQMSGINANIFYATEIFIAAKSPLSAELETIIVGVMQLFGTFFSVFLVDRLGRKVLLLLSGISMAISTTVIGIYFNLKKQDESYVSHLGWLPLTALCVFFIMFSIGYGPIPWIIIGEIFAPDIKGLAGSMAATISWLLSFTVSKTFTSLRDVIGIDGVFWFFSAFSYLGIIFIYFIVPETKGKSHSDIQKMLSKNE